MAARAQERILIDHDEIRRWAEKRGAVPAKVKGTGGPDDVGILRLHFPEFSQDDEKLEEISWDEFFDEFDKKRLALLVEDRMPDGRRSNFNKIISRQTIEDFVRSADSASRRPSTSARSTTAASLSSQKTSTAKTGGAGARSKKQPIAIDSRTGSRRRSA